MQEQGSPSSEQLSFILIVAGPEDARAIELIQTLRKAGLRVFFGETVTLAARLASEVAVCVAVLRPDTWKSQTIAVAMRAKPACFIPVLAETMDLPRGPWTRPAIDLTINSEQGEQELIQLLRDYLATPATPTRAQRKQSALTPLNAVRIRPLRPRRQRRRKVGTIITTILLLLIILGLGGLLGYRYYTHPPKALNTSTTSLPILNSSEYHANVPGPCDGGGGQWKKGDRYVTTVNNKKVEVMDKYTTLACQADGALVTRTGDEDFYSELFFDGPAGQTSLAPHYMAQVSATILSGDTQTGLTIDVHIQNYARYAFNVNATGRWKASLDSKVDGTPISTLASGYLSTVPSKLYTLTIEVYGPTMTYWINGTQITSVTDATYTSNESLAFGVDDYGASKPVSALFSNFQYKVLPNTMTSAQIMATATALAQKNAQTPYTAHVPGYGCDKGAGQWEPLTDNSGKSGTIHCLANGMQLTEPASTNFIAEEHFFWLNEHFPQNYKVSAKIDVSAAASRCAGLGTRQQMGHNAGGYFFMICPDGSWAIILITDKFHVLTQGTVAAQNIYTITAESNGSEQSLYIDGQFVQKVKDTHLTGTDYVSLDVGLYASNQTVSAIFSNFTFTPLP